MVECGWLGGGEYLEGILGGGKVALDLQESLLLLSRSDQLLGQYPSSCHVSTLACVAYLALLDPGHR